jgi:hypothetical protein
MHTTAITHRQRLQITFRGKTLDELKQSIASALRDAVAAGGTYAADDDQVRGEQIEVAKFLLHNGTYVPLRDAPLPSASGAAAAAAESNDDAATTTTTTTTTTTLDNTTGATAATAPAKPKPVAQAKKGGGSSKKRGGDRLRGQPYHLRDGDVLAFRVAAESHDDFASARRARAAHHSANNARGSLADVVARSRRDEPSLTFDIDFDDQP